MNAKGTPALAVATGSLDKVKGALVRCTICSIERIAGSSKDSDLAQISFETPAGVPTEITDAIVVAIGDKHRKSLNEGQAKAGSETIATNLIRVTVNLSGNKIKPDRYTGALRLSVAGVETPVSYPVEITVKDGPLNALAALFVGALAALLFGIGSRKNSQYRAYSKLEALRSRATKVLGAESRRVEPALRRASDEIKNGQIDAAVEIMRAVEKRIGVLEAMVDIERLFPAYKERLNAVRDLIELGEDSAAKTKLDEIKKEIGDADQADVRMMDFLDQAILNVQYAAQHYNAVESLPTGVWRLVQWLWRRLGGLDDWTVLASRRVWRLSLRVLLGLATLLAICFVALKAQYIDGSETFGSDPLWDYFALVVVGFTGAVTQRLAVNVKPPSA